MANPPLVLIEWEDSARPVATWQYLDDIEGTGPIRCQSVGYLIDDGESVKTLAPNVGELGTEAAQASGVIRIPTRCITRVRKLSLAR